MSEASRTGLVLTKVLDQTVELGSFSLGFTDGGGRAQNRRSQGRVVAAHGDL